MAAASSLPLSASAPVPRLDGVVWRFFALAVMKTLQSGFTLVFGGPDFVPDDFLNGSRLTSFVDHVIRRGAPLRNGKLADESWIEFEDIHEGTYPLDAFTEALDFLQDYQDEFLRLANFPGVTTRTLNFFGDAGTCTMEIEPTRIALLHELSLHLSICPYVSATDG